MVTRRLNAVVRVVLEVEADSVWSDNTTIDQIVKQAVTDVRGMLTTELSLKTLQQKIKSIETVGVNVYFEDRKESR